MSDSDQGDLDLEALKSIFGDKAFDDMTPTKENQKKSSSKKTNKSGSKRTQKQKKPAIDLDALLDGIDVDSIPNDNNDDGDLDFLNTQKKEKSNTQSIKNYGNDIYDFRSSVDVFANFEKKIEKYLDSSINAMQNDIIKEIEQILIESDNFDDITINFLEKLKHSIHEIIMHEKTSISSIQNPFYSIFDDFSNSFLECFRKIGEYSSNNYGKNTNIIRSCRNLVEVKKPIFERQMNNAVHNINQEINELNRLKLRDSSFEMNNAKKIRNYFHQQVLLEGKVRALEEINDNVLKKIEKLQESKNQLFTNTGSKFPDDDVVLKHVSKASRYLKNIFLKKKLKDSNLVKTKLDKFYLACEDLMTTIIQAEYALNMISRSNSETQKVFQDKESTSVEHTNSKPSKIVEESRNSLMDCKNKRESQYQEINRMINRLSKRNETQIDE